MLIYNIVLNPAQVASGRKRMFDSSTCKCQKIKAGKFLKEADNFERRNQLIRSSDNADDSIEFIPQHFILELLFQRSQ